MGVEYGRLVGKEEPKERQNNTCYVISNMCYVISNVCYVISNFGLLSVMKNLSWEKIIQPFF